MLKCKISCCLHYIPLHKYLINTFSRKYMYIIAAADVLDIKIFLFPNISIGPHTKLFSERFSGFHFSINKDPFTTSDFVKTPLLLSQLKTQSI